MIFLGQLIQTIQLIILQTANHNDVSTFPD